MHSNQLLEARLALREYLDALPVGGDGVKLANGCMVRHESALRFAVTSPRHGIVHCGIGGAMGVLTDASVYDDVARSEYQIRQRLLMQIEARS